MKMKKRSFTLTLATLLMLTTLPSLAMDLNIKAIDGGDDTTNNSTATKPYAPPINYGTYPSKISFILGYSRVSLKNAEPSNLFVPQNQNSFQQQLNSAPLNGIKLGLTQFITPNWGYEVAMNYYLSETYSANYSGYNDPPLDMVTTTANSSVDNKLWTVEALAVGGWHLSQNWLLLGKLGLGYEYLTQTNPITGARDISGETPFTFGSTSTYKAHSPGIAGGAGIRYSLTNNFSFEMGLNDLMGKRNLLIYEANLLVKA